MLGHSFSVHLDCPCKANFVLVVLVGSEFLLSRELKGRYLCFHISSTTLKVASLN